MSGKVGEISSIEVDVYGLVSSVRGGETAQCPGLPGFGGVEPSTYSRPNEITALADEDKLVVQKGCEGEIASPSDIDTTTFRRAVALWGDVKESLRLIPYGKKEEGFVPYTPTSKTEARIKMHDVDGMSSTLVLKDNDGNSIIDGAFIYLTSDQKETISIALPLDVLAKMGIDPTVLAKEALSAQKTGR